MRRTGGEEDKGEGAISIWEPAQAKTRQAAGDRKGTSGRQGVALFETRPSKGNANAEETCGSWRSAALAGRRGRPSSSIGRRLERIWHAISRGSPSSPADPRHPARAAPSGVQDASRDQARCTARASASVGGGEAPVWRRRCMAAISRCPCPRACDESMLLSTTVLLTTTTAANGRVNTHGRISAQRGPCPASIRFSLNPPSCSRRAHSAHARPTAPARAASLTHDGGITTSGSPRVASKSSLASDMSSAIAITAPFSRLAARRCRPPHLHICALMTGPPIVGGGRHGPVNSSRSNQLRSPSTHRQRHRFKMQRIRREPASYASAG